MPPRPTPFRSSPATGAASAALLLVLGMAPAWADGPPQLRPMRLSSGGGGSDGSVQVDLARRPAAAASEPASASGPVSGPAAIASRPPAAPAVHDEIDPLEVLRQRLAGRLARQNATDTASPYDLKIVARTGPPPTAQPAGPSAAATRPVAARSTRPAAPGATTAARTATAGAPAQPWAYAGAAGAPAWASLNPDYALCGNGQRQSPVDLRGGLPVDLEPVRFLYQPGRFSVLDNGRGLQVNLAPGNTIEVAGRRYELQSASFHRPSEHRIDGRSFEMSLHLLHRDAEGNTAIVALQIDPGPPQAASQLVLNHLPLEKRAENPGRVPLDPAKWLPDDTRYYTYMGSLSEPPCSEGVQWVVMREPVTLSREQLELFARLYPMNARPVQALAGRRILQSQ